MSAAEGRGGGARGRAVQQVPGLWRTDLQRQDLSVPGREVVQSRVAIGAEAPLVRHTHAGEEIIYVLEGSLEYQIEGQSLMTFNAGDALTSRPERSARCGILAAAMGRNSPPMSPKREAAQ
jgi:quercetin dioxygenase-like cupin family protein